MKLLILNGEYKVHSIVPNVANVTEVSDQAIKWTDTANPEASPSYENADPTYKLVYLVVDDSLEINVGDPAPYDMVLDFKKKRKIKELDAQCNEVMFGGVTVASTGNQYSTTPYDLQFMNMKATYINMFPEDTAPFRWLTLNNGKVLHTVEQFKEVCQAVHNHLASTIEHYWSLQDQVNAATTIEEVEAIQW